MRRRHGADASAERLPRAREALADLSSVLGDRVARIGLFGPTAQSPPPRLVTSFPARTAECDPLASEPYLCVIIGTVWQRPGWLGECVDGRKGWGARQTIGRGAVLGCEGGVKAAQGGASWSPTDYRKRGCVGMRGGGEAAQGGGRRRSASQHCIGGQALSGCGGGEHQRTRQ